MPEPLPYALLSAAGNRILILDASQGKPTRLDCAALQPRLDPGWSFDQLIVLAHQRGKWQVRIYNRDGSPAEQCGNGMRCLAAWLDRGVGLAAGGLEVVTPVGPVRLQKSDKDDFRVALPPPSFDPNAVKYRGPTCFDPEPSLVSGCIPAKELHPATRPAFGDARAVFFDLVSLGNPHAILWRDPEDTALAAFPLAAVASSIRSHFEHGVNLSVARKPKPSAGRIEARVEERGVGETPACGSAACAIAAVAWLRRWIGSRSEIVFPGGTLEVIWKGPGEPIWLGGPVQWLEVGELR